MNEYISREALLAEIAADYGNWIACHDTDELYRQGVEDNYSDTMRLINDFPAADVQPIVYAHKTINVGRRSYCSNCGKLAIMEDFCSKCGAKVKDDAKDNNVRNLTDEETEIYDSWLNSEAKDTGVNIMDGDT